MDDSCGIPYDSLSHLHKLLTIYPDNKIGYI